LLFIFVGYAFAYADKYYGVDVSSFVSKGAFDCLKAQNLTYAIIRGYQSIGSPDPNVVATTENAHDAGVSRVDIYMFPCPQCAASGTDQVKQLKEYIDAHKVRFSTLWLDIEGPQYWRDQSFNRNFFNELVKAVEGYKIPLGIYTSESQWIPIFGSFTGGSHLPLWYANYDGVPDFNDFSSFGGWRTPVMKQFSDAGAKCGASYDIDWSPKEPPLGFVRK